MFILIQQRWSQQETGAKSCTHSDFHGRCAPVVFKARLEGMVHASDERPRKTPCKQHPTRCFATVYLTHTPHILLSQAFCCDFDYWEIFIIRLHMLLGSLLLALSPRSTPSRPLNPLFKISGESGSVNSKISLFFSFSSPFPLSPSLP